MLAFIILAIIDIIILMKINQGVVTQGAAGDWTVYGTMGCGWTRKQLEHMKKSGKPHTFVDCDKEGCNGMDAYPTLVSPEGEKTVGYKEV
jgi:hypothetical protein